MVQCNNRTYPLWGECRSNKTQRVAARIEKRVLGGRQVLINAVEPWKSGVVHGLEILMIRGGEQSEMWKITGTARQNRNQNYLILPHSCIRPARSERRVHRGVKRLRVLLLNKAMPPDRPCMALGTFTRQLRPVRIEGDVIVSVFSGIVHRRAESRIADPTAEGSHTTSHSSKPWFLFECV